MIVRQVEINRTSDSRCKLSSMINCLRLSTTWEAMIWPLGPSGVTTTPRSLPWWQKWTWSRQTWETRQTKLRWGKQPNRFRWKRLPRRALKRNLTWSIKSIQSVSIPAKVWRFHSRLNRLLPSRFKCSGSTSIRHLSATTSRVKMARCNNFVRETTPYLTPEWCLRGPCSRN